MRESIENIRNWFLLPKNVTTGSSFILFVCKSYENSINWFLLPTNVTTWSSFISFVCKCANRMRDNIDWIFYVTTLYMLQYDINQREHMWISIALTGLQFEVPKHMKYVASLIVQSDPLPSLLSARPNLWNITSWNGQIKLSRAARDVCRIWDSTISNWQQARGDDHSSE